MEKRTAIADVTSPLARRLLAIVAILSIAVTGVATAVTFVFVQRSAADAQMRHLTEYVAERVKTEDRLFSDLVKVHEAASDSLARRLQALDPRTVERDFDAQFPKHGDGTRRTADALYDGEVIDGDYTYGIGGYLRDADILTPDQKALFLAVTQVVSHTGEAELNRYDNFYFFTPDTRLVMFGPRRPDRLTYYRHKAPPTFDVSGEEMTLLTLPKQNSERVMKCTKLRKLLSDPSGRGLNSACMTPFDYHGRQLGAWGTSLSLDSYLLRAVEDALPGGRNMIVSSDGELIAAPGLARNGVVDVQTLVRAQTEEGVADVVRQIRALGADVGAIRHGDRVIAYGRLKEPDWYFLMSFPSSDLVWSAVKTASWVLLFGVLGAIIQVALLYRLMRLTVERPLRLLAEAHRTGDVVEAEAIEDRTDEIGALARTLRDQRDGNIELLRSLEERVAERTAELERANQAKSVFLANMSHELRTPLNGVIAIGDRLAEESDPERRRELAALVTSSGRLLEQVLGDILDVSKIEAGQFQLTPAPFDLATLVGGVAELHRASAQAKALDFRWSIQPGASGSYLGDAGRISQILNNLLANAVKFTVMGEVALSVESTAEGLSFIVSDTGVGFDDTVRRRLFKRFVQADQSITRQFGGTGLGLSICAALVEMMGGRIDARAVLGRGAIFQVDLPLARIRAVEDVAPDDEEEISLEGLRVLVAEDHPTNQKVVEIILQPFDVALTMVEDGQAALDAFIPGAFDVVLMDMQMPVMDGLTATRLIREREAAAVVPPVLLIMLTANAMEEHVAAAKAVGADLHLAKPVRPAQLLEALARARVTGVSAVLSTAE
ncbi:ATP-binding protein [Caulobacter sp. UNC279MFTsu5.1]|uniref:ATP-binding protein n=1 Tax=Caulobacter sp. UNC279MFTsu5.1 TaxID=1502775 RepID=UPI000B7D3F9F|nr:ATP-binding protein [Caulobacter sp. UNC279MFTsu5.1]